MQVDPSEDGGHKQVLDQTAKLGEVNGLTLKGGNNPTDYDEGGVDSGERGVERAEVRFSIREDFSHFNQNRRKKKYLNKQIQFMHEIQDSVLSTKEKQQRDRKERIRKGKMITRGEDPIVNLSLSDSDINNRRRVILREAKKTWEVGKKLGLSVRGDEEEVVEEIRRLEDLVLIIEEKWVKEDLEAVLINIYAPNITAEKSILWGKLSELRSKFTSQWIVGGDFNVVRCRSERSYCWGSEKGTREFENFIFDCNLIDLPLVRKKFTWYRPENKKSRLDRFLLDEFWLLKMKDLQQLGLKRLVSVHIPILLADAEVDWVVGLLSLSIDG
ncbi:hypothetical protein CXB51_035176 [Gossypium anomalum]|uniref:Endonuclease/exonuclease/phosphatase domain-containing protein n=1 Tax=Gossypium anomalum TaxID=47600 RepID=A0A8J6CI09_9ROSI|nr:hypothetical protein CXB51_035176 [Gossypium anomalum]